MTEERRYTEEDAAAIFQRATEAQQGRRPQLPPGEGMTLAELQAIGREVGIPSDLVALAARSIEQGGRPSSRTFLGLPIGVGRTIELDRRLSDTEWEQLVGDLRETFDARGTVRYDGPFRQWTNGNLQALLEPTPAGHRIRLRTLKGNARAMMTAGLGLLGIGAATVVAALVGGVAGDTWSSASLLAVLGLGMFGAGAVQVPGWARLRSRQMEAVAARLTESEGPPRLDDPETSGD
jgi:hypothetical protein